MLIQLLFLLEREILQNLNTLPILILQIHDKR